MIHAYINLRGAITVTRIHLIDHTTRGHIEPLIVVSFRSVDVSVGFPVLLQRVIHAKLFPNFLLSVLRLLPGLTLIVCYAQGFFSMRCDTQCMSTMRPKVERGRVRYNLCSKA